MSADNIRRLIQMAQDEVVPGAPIEEVRRMRRPQHGIFIAPRPPFDPMLDDIGEIGLLPAPPHPLIDDVGEIGLLPAPPRPVPVRRYPPHYPVDES
jgi:hypothetical protein